MREKSCDLVVIFEISSLILYWVITAPTQQAGGGAF